MNNIEIEIKIKIEKNNFMSLKQFLKENANYIGSSRQVDQYYSAPHRDFLEPEYPYEWLRIRKSKGITILNYKHWHPENSPTSTHCDEFESVVSEPSSLEAIFNAINIDLLIKVDKIREKFIYQKDFEISLDHVLDLGYFIEIEYKGLDISIEIVNEKLIQVSESLGLDLVNKDNRGYPYLMLEKVGQLKK